MDKIFEMKKMFTAELSRVHFLVHRCTGARPHPQQRATGTHKKNKPTKNTTTNRTTHHGGRRPILPATPLTSTPRNWRHRRIGGRGGCGFGGALPAGRAPPKWRLLQPARGGRADQPPDRQPDHGRNHGVAFGPLPSNPSKTALANSGIAGMVCGVILAP